MTNDDSLKAVRDSRQKISKSLDHNPKKLVEYYKNLQSRHVERLVSERSSDRHLKSTKAA